MKSVFIKIKKITQTQYFKLLLKILLVVLVLVSLLLNLFTYVMPIVHYRGDSMEPNIKNGQILIVRKTQKVKEGDVIAFYYNNKVLVRRVICSGGKQISIDVFGEVSIDQNPLEENYVVQKSYGQCNISFPYNVPPKDVFVMGDDREVSMDSRLKEIGTISQDRIIGRVEFSLIPLKSVD